MKIITFDVTNTLIKVALGVGQQYNKVLLKSKFGVYLDKELTDTNFRRLFKQQNQSLPGYGFRQGMSSRHWWNLLSKQLIRENWRVHRKPVLSEEELDVAANILFDEFCRKDYWQKFEHCDNTLRELQQAGYRLGIISNFDERIYKILENMGIHGYFDFVQIPSSCHGFAKPSAEIFEATRQLAGQRLRTTDSPQFLHVGDSVELDYRAARNAGFKALLMCHNRAELSKLDAQDVILRNEDYATDLAHLKQKILDKYPVSE